MPAPASIAEFLDLVRRSGVLEDARLDAYLRQHPEHEDRATSLTGFARQTVRDGLLTQFQAEQFIAGKWKRFSIGKYRVLERLGSGGMGQVFLCEHKLMRRRVAVKVLPASKAEEPAALERFYREARAVASLDHPNLVRAFDIDQDADLHFLVMEFVEGASLQEIVRKHGPMDPIRAAHYLHQAAVGLDYANQVAGLIHRDIKPGNIMVDRMGVVKILDMGLARFFNDEADVLTRKYDESVLGTADYLSPEQAIDSHSVDIRADIYSLGATFYFVLTGQPPFPDGTVAQKLIWHQSKQPKPLAEVRRGLPGELVQVIERMMRKSPGERYSTPGEITGDLVALTSVPIPPPPDAEMPQLSLAAMAGATSAPSNPRAMAARLPAAGRSGAALGSSGAMNRPPVSGFTPASAISRASLDQTATPSPALAETELNPFRKMMTPGEPSPDRSVVERRTLESVYAARGLAGAGAPAGDGRVNRRSALILGSAGALTGLAALVWWLASGKSPATKPAAPEKAVAASRELIVNPAGGEYRTLLDAVRKSRPGDRIVIRATMIQETLQLDGRSFGRGDITIESGRADGLPVVWSPPANVSPTAHLVELIGYEGVRLKNVVFDGQGRIETPVRIACAAAGTTVQGVHVRGFTRTAIRLVDAVGQSDRPLSITGCRFQAGARADAGVHLSGTNSAKPLQFVRIVDNQFDGPFAAGVLGDGPASDLAIEWNRFHRAGDGVVWKKLDPDQTLRVRVDGNTFHELRTAGLRFGGAAAGSPSSVVVRRNLFSKCPTVLTIEDKTGPAFLESIGNVRDGSGGDGDLPLPARTEERIDFQSVDPASKEFLRYGRTSRLATASPDGGPVGVPPAP
jgi:serine/threonine protein kinase